MMSLTLTGDMARHFQSLRNGTALRRELDQLATELTSGVTRDAAAHLAGRGDRLVLLDRQIALRSAELTSAQALGQRLATAQTALQEVEGQRGSLSAMLVALSPAATAGTISNASAQAEAGFHGVVAALNIRHGDETVFAGTATDGPALASAGTMLGALRAAVAGAGSVDDLVAQVDAFFTDPGGGFASIGYAGETGLPDLRRLGEGAWVPTGPRADDAALRGVLRDLALATVAADPALGLTPADRAVVLRQAGVALISAAEPLSAVRAALGSAEQQVAEAADRHAAGVASATLMRNDLVALDASTTATRLTQVQTQLETHYTVTARLAGLSLAGYLR